jgi:hypothetical protein
MHAWMISWPDYMVKINKSWRTIFLINIHLFFTASISNDDLSEICGVHKVYYFFSNKISLYAKIRDSIWNHLFQGFKYVISLESIIIDPSILKSSNVGPFLISFDKKKDVIYFK